jgi:hypothetical protein
MKPIQEIVTKEDLIAGEKLLRITTRAGETKDVLLTALSARELKKILTRHPDDGEEVLLRASLRKSAFAENVESFLDSLDMESMTDAQRVANALSLGIEPIKKMEAAAMKAMAATASSGIAPSAN